jgi:hypothetical protein
LAINSTTITLLPPTIRSQIIIFFFAILFLSLTLKNSFKILLPIIEFHARPFYFLKSCHASFFIINCSSLELKDLNYFCLTGLSKESFIRHSHSLQKNLHLFLKFCHSLINFVTSNFIPNLNLANHLKNYSRKCYFFLNNLKYSLNAVL